MQFAPRHWLFLIGLIAPTQAQLLQKTNPFTSSNPNRGIHIADLQIEGLKKVDEAMVLQRLNLKVGRDYSTQALNENVRSSIESLHNSGLFADLRVEKEDMPGGTKLIVVVKEKSTLNDLKLSGNHKLDSTALWDQIDLRKGQVYGASDLERIRQRLLKKYRSEGFLMAQIEAQETEIDDQEYDLAFNISEGKKVVVSDIQITGNTAVDHTTLINSLASKLDKWYSSGDYKEENLAADKDSLLETMKSKGYLDSRVTLAKAEYLPDSSYHFYLGSTAAVRDSLDALLGQINQDLSHSTPLAKVIALNSDRFNPFTRRFGGLNNLSPNLTLSTESELVQQLNSLLDSRKARTEFLTQVLPSRTWQNPELANAKADANEAQTRKWVRLALEEMYALQKHADLIMTDRVRLQFAVEEGKQYKFGRVFFEGNEVYSKLALEAQMQLDSGKVFNNKLYKSSLQNIYNLYREEGYIFLNLQDERNIHDNNVVDLAFKIEEGKPAHIRRVQINGNTTTADKVIRREIKLFPGDIFSQSLMERSYRDIMQLNYFDNVKPDMKVVGEQDVDLVYDVEEKKAGTGTFSAGMSYNANDGIVGNLSVSIPNFQLNPIGIGGGQQVNASVEFGPYRRSASLGFTEPWFRDRPTTVGGNISWSEYKDQTGYYSDQTRYGARTFLGKRLTWPDDYFYIQGDLSWYWNDQNGADYGSVRPSGTEGAIGLNITRDDKNLPMFPTDGSRYNLRLQKVGGLRDANLKIGDFEYFRTEATVNWWFPVFKNFSLGLSNELGVLDGQVIQQNQLYRMGGTMGYNGKMRGYGSGSIGTGQLGRSYLASSAEFVYTVAPGTFYLLPFFFDAGNVYGGKLLSAVKGANALPSPWREIDLNDLRKDIGAGFRVVVPMMGILGFDFAWPMDVRQGESQSMQTNFVISQGF